MNEKPWKTILLADDDLFYREMISLHLESHGFSVVKTHSGSDALKRLLSKGQYSLAILDIFMGGKTGFEVLEQFKKAVDFCETDDLPVIAITSDDSEGTELRIRAARANMFLLKPFTKEALLEAVEQLMR